MNERHWVDDAGLPDVVTAVLLMHDTPGREEPIWAVHGHLAGHGLG
jgi:hypothetical protein